MRTLVSLRTLFVALLAQLATVVPAAAQIRRPPPPPPAPRVSLRPFGMATLQEASAATTFDAVFGSRIEPFFGAGLQLAFREGWFAEVGASRLKKTGERAFISGGQTFGLGIPLSTTMTPLEVTGGYRFNARRPGLVVPYVGAGIGSYAYTETANFAATGDDVDVRHVGYLAVGGAEVRVHKWVGVAIDVQYTHIPGILGAAGLSKVAGESDLGGVAGRIKVLVGR